MIENVVKLSKDKPTNDVLLQIKKDGKITISEYKKLKRAYLSKDYGNVKYK